MKFFCYILYSKSINRYYIGYTSDINERLKLHNSGYFGGRSYTHKASDWAIFCLIPCETVEQAVFLASKIKKMKSRKYVENLKQYPGIIEKIMKEFHK